LAVEGDLKTALGTLVSSRCFALVAPDLTPTPYIIYSVVSNIPQVSLDGPTGTENRRVQVDVWGGSYGEVKALEVTVKSTMAASSIRNVPLSTMDMYESETKLYRVTMDYSIWT